MFLERVNDSTQGELNVFEVEPVQRGEPKKKETVKLMGVTVITRFLLRDNVSKKQFVQRYSKN